MEIKKKFGSNVRDLRKLANISQEELALRLNADQAYVSRIEAGQMNVTLETIDEIAKALNVSAKEFFE
ncbi:helix-turn-helix transcriptional regulator [Hyphomicrobiales bacterium 4NK60-0047b]